MGYDEAALGRVRHILSGHEDVVEKRMVGGRSFSVNGSMFCGVTGSALMVRVGRDERDRVLAEPHVRPMEFAGRPLAGFVLVEHEGFTTDMELARWVNRGIEFMTMLPPKERVPSKPRSSPARR